MAGSERRGWSWPDAVLDLVARAPGPNWLAWLAIFLVFLLLAGLVGLAAGAEDQVLAWGNAALSASFAPILLGAMQGLNGVARRSLRTLSPAMDADASTLAALATEVTRTPAGLAWLLTAVGIVIGVGSVTSSPEGWGITADSSGLFWAQAMVNSVISVTCVLVFIGHAAQQLRVVARIHRDLVRVDLFRLQPLYAFAALTSWTGAVLIFLVIYGVVALSIINGSFILGPIDLGVLVAILLVAIACFVLPLLGLHGRIQAEKDRRLAEANATLDRVIAEIRERVASGDWEAMPALHDGVAAATATVSAIGRISTWPWRPETLRGFLSAVALPIVLWLVTTGLARAFGG